MIKGNKIAGGTLVDIGLVTGNSLEFSFLVRDDFTRRNFIGRRCDLLSAEGKTEFDLTSKLPSANTVVSLPIGPWQCCLG